MKLILISPEHNIKDEHKLLNFFFEKGLKYFHLRKPTFDLQSLSKYIENIKFEYRKYIILHSHFSLIEKYNLKGAHFGIKNISLFLEYKNKNIHKSYSAHTFEELLKYKNDFDYIFISPVFDSISKKNYRSSFSPDDIKQFININKLNNIAGLGGLSVGNIRKTKNIGFSGLAFLGYIWNVEFEEAKKRFLKTIMFINKY